MVFFPNITFKQKTKKISFLGKFAFFPVKNHYIHHDPPFCRKRVAPLQSQRRYSPDLDVWHFSSPDFHRDQGQQLNLMHYLAASPIGVLAGQLEPGFPNFFGPKKKNQSCGWRTENLPKYQRVIVYYQPKTMLCVFLGKKSLKITPNICIKFDPPK